MSLGLVGKKIGMTRIFDEAGAAEAVSVVQVFPTKVAQHKTVADHGYDAVQLAYYINDKNSANSPLTGHCKKSGVPVTGSFKEFLLNSSEDFSSLPVGADVNVSIFAVGQVVDVTGVSKGKGFAGTVKRHNFATQDATHGNSRSHRVPGSIGQRQTPGRVFKGKKMAGHLGSKKCTVQNLQIKLIDIEKNLLLIKGAIPGAKGSRIVLTPAVKSSDS